MMAHLQGLTNASPFVLVSDESLIFRQRHLRAAVGWLSSSHGGKGLDEFFSLHGLTTRRW